LVQAELGTVGARNAEAIQLDSIDEIPKALLSFCPSFVALTEFSPIASSSRNCASTQVRTANPDKMSGMEEQEEAASRQNFPGSAAER
jgi:hypothetical protein